MVTRRVALILGIVYVLVGLMGFIPALNPMHMDAPPLKVTSFYGYELGLFPINLLHNLVHIIIGALGIALSRNWGSARGFFRGLTVFYGLLAIMGFISALGLNTTFGLIPIFGNDTWLHGLTTLLAIYFGWFAPREETTFIDAGRAAHNRA